MFWRAARQSFPVHKNGATRERPGVVDDEVQVALAVPGLLVAEPRVVLGQHVEAGAEQLQRLGHQAELARGGAAAEAGSVPQSTLAQKV